MEHSDVEKLLQGIEDEAQERHARVMQTIYNVTRELKHAINIAKYDSGATVGATLEAKAFKEDGARKAYLVAGIAIGVMLHFGVTLILKAIPF